MYSLGFNVFSQNEKKNKIVNTMGFIGNIEDATKFYNAKKSFKSALFLQSPLCSQKENSDYNQKKQKSFK